MLKKFLIFTIFFICLSNSWAAGSLSFQAGLNQHNSPEFKEYEINAKGTSFMASAGIYLSKLELDLYYGKSQSKAKIIHDGTENYIDTDVTRLGVGAIMFVTNNWYFIIGMGRTTIDQEIQNSVSTNVDAAIKDIYKLKEEQDFTELRYGTAFHLFNMSGISLYTSADYYTYSSIELNEMVVSIGFKTRL